MGTDESSAAVAKELIKAEDTKVEGVIRYVFTEEYVLKEMNAEVAYTESSQLVLPDFTDWGQTATSNGEGVVTPSGEYQIYTCDSTADFDEIWVKLNGDKVEYFTFVVSATFDELDITENDVDMVVSYMNGMFNSGRDLKLM